MKLIVGLGNPGEKYKNNRHNVGFKCIDYLAKHEPLNDLTLIKPKTFMNKSGEEVKKLIEYGKLDINNLIVIHDDLDIPFGKFRIVKGYGPKLHNGIESIQNHLHTMDFLRIRIGVDNRNAENRIPGIDYVLQDFTSEEQSKLNIIFSQIIDRMRIEKIIR